MGEMLISIVRLPVIWIRSSGMIIACVIGGKNKMIDLNVIRNTDCLTHCSKEKRKDITIGDRCSECTSVIDGLEVRCVGPWGKEKIHHLIQYFGIFARGMKDKWSGKLNYIEICSGPGRCIDRETGDEFNGTPIAIAEHPDRKYLNTALFFDYESEIVHSLNHRLSKYAGSSIKASLGDYNDSNTICNILNDAIGGRQYLNLVFIDPTDCSIPFATIRDIKKTLKSADLIINVATKTDFNRNVRNIIEKNDRYQNAYNKYTAFLGSDSYFHNKDVVRFTANRDYINLRRLFREHYIDSLRSIGYSHFAVTPINNYYDLLFACGHSRGLDFWNKIKMIDHTGQREFDLFQED